jgi:hypothetical protein
MKKLNAVDAAPHWLGIPRVVVRLARLELAAHGNDLMQKYGPWLFDVS